MTCAINWDLIRLIKAIQYMHAIFRKKNANPNCTQYTQT